MCALDAAEHKVPHALEGVGGREAERLHGPRPAVEEATRMATEEAAAPMATSGGGRLFVGLADAAAGTAARAGRPQAQRARGGSQREERDACRQALEYLLALPMPGMQSKTAHERRTSEVTAGAPGFNASAAAKSRLSKALPAVLSIGSLEEPSARRPRPRPR